MRDILFNTFNAVLPIFLFILCGFSARAAGIIRREEVGTINKLNFSVFIPILVAYNIHNSDLSTAFRLDFIAFPVFGLLTEVGLGWLFAHFFVKKRAQKGVVIQGLFRTNIALMGIHLLANLVPGADLGPISLLVAFTTITINTSSVIVLEIYSSQKIDAKRLIKSILRNPILIGCFCGLLLLLTGATLPQAVETTMRDMSRIATPLALFLLGSFFRFEDLRRDVRLLAAIAVFRLAVFPAIFLSLAAVLGFRGIYFATLIPVFATPTAAPSFAMVQRIGGDADLAGNIVVVTSLFCSLTIFAWCFLFQYLGLF